MKQTADILKVGAIILSAEGRLLISKSYNKDIWIFVGGKIENGETHEDCLRRELKEELGVEVVGTPTFYIQSPVEIAAGDAKGRTVQIFEYLVDINSEPKPSAEVESIHWLSADEFQTKIFPLGSILEHYAIPALIADGKMR